MGSSGYLIQWCIAVQILLEWISTMVKKQLDLFMTDFMVVRSYQFKKHGPSIRI
ncbi:hypothetical protein BJX66DRAFT_316926 [Aspergillus keveii]|uniref:Uncharacterized protein n=1 Tax=Aspergillus keveii TaxID=714993 RepID=A0ABR4FLX4_9EURO